MAAGTLLLPSRPRLGRSKRANVGLIRCLPLGLSRAAAEMELCSRLDGTWSGSGDHVATAELGSVGNFPSKDDFISLGNSWSAFVRADCTVMLWVNILSMSNGSKTIIGGVSDGYQPLFLVTASTTDAGTGLLICWTSNSAIISTDGLALNTWHRLVLTRSGNTISLYKNGAFVNSGTAGGNTADDTKVLNVGGSAAWATAYAMQASDVRLYNRALSASEIALDYAAGSRALTVLRKPYRRIVTTFQLNAIQTQAGETAVGVNRIDTLDAGFPDGEFTITVVKDSVEYTTAGIAADASAAAIQSAIDAVIPVSVSVTVSGGPHDTTDITMEWPYTAAPDTNGVWWTYESSNHTDTPLTQQPSGDITVDEQQSITFSDLPLSGTFTLTLGSDTTDPIAWNATAAEVAAALEAAISGATVTVVTDGVLADGDAIELSFGGSLQGTDIALLTADLTGLSTLPGGVAMIGMGVLCGTGVLT